MFSAPHRRFGSSLSFRLFVLNTFVSCAAISLCLGLVYEGIRVSRYSLVDDFLDEELDAVCGELDGDGTMAALRRNFARRAEHHPRRKLFIQMLDADRNVAWSSPHSPTIPLVESNDRADDPVTAGDFRFVQRAATLPGGTPAIIRVGVSLERMRMEMQLFAWVLAVVAGAFMLGAPFLGLLLTSRALRPFARIIATTDQIIPGNLDARLPSRGAGSLDDQIATTINGLLERLCRHLRLNQELIANAAHELRSPLTALRSSLDLALQAERTNEEYQSIIAEVLEDCDLIGGLVHKMLLLAESDGGTLCASKEPVALERIVDRAAEMYQAVAELKNVAFSTRWTSPVPIMGDAQALAILVHNLIDNAIKFTDPGGSVTVELMPPSTVKAAELQVVDTGQGIDPEDLPRVFERFFRGDRSRRRNEPAPGHGLGLSLCDAIVRAHGGTIAVESVLGKGSTFRVTLPICAEPTTEAPARTGGTAVAAVRTGGTPVPP